MAPSPARRRGTFGAFRQPFLTDPIFWIAAVLALAVGLLAGGALFALGGLPDSLVMWAVSLGVTLVVAWLSFKLLAMGLNTSRALESTEVADEARARNLEDKGRAAGAVLGKGAAKLVKGRKPGGGTPPESAPAAGAAPAAAPAPTPAPAPASPTADPDGGPTTAPSPDPAPEVTVDKAARVLGSMVGRRLADRKKD